MFIARILTVIRVYDFYCFTHTIAVEHSIQNVIIYIIMYLIKMRGYGGSP